MTRQPRISTRSTVTGCFAVILAGFCTLSTACRGGSQTEKATGPTAPTRGGAIVASVHTDPRSFNRLVVKDSTLDLVATLSHAKLVRLNRVTQEVEPWLAESWTRSDDGLQYTVTLRPDITFSDGHAFTADDVLFSFEAAYDEKSGSVEASSLHVGGKPLQVSVLDPRTIRVIYPEPFGPGVRILNNLTILPRHKLGAALKDGTFAKAWGLSTPVDELVGLGPFQLREYASGQRLVFERNPRYWRRDAQGIALPYLDKVTIEIIPDQDAELLRLEAGQLDMTTSELRPEDYAPLRRAADARKVQLLDLGPGFDPDHLWFNLKPGALAKDSRAPWLQSDALRRAISFAVDRQLFANTVFLGAAVPVSGPITPANRRWFAGLQEVPHDPVRARRELAVIGLTDRNGDGTLEDMHNQPVRFSLLAQKGNSSIERGAAVIRDELKKIGVTVDVVALDGNAVIQRFLSANYDAVYFHLTTTEMDPGINADFWFSNGSAHAWNLGQEKPATEWERQIDDLMRLQMSTLDEVERKLLFDQVQRIFAEHVPMLEFAVPKIYVAASTRVTNLTPTAFSRPQLLWAPDTIAVVH